MRCLWKEVLGVISGRFVVTSMISTTTQRYVSASYRKCEGKFALYLTNLRKLHHFRELFFMLKVISFLSPSARSPSLRLILFEMINDCQSCTSPPSVRNETHPSIDKKVTLAALFSPSPFQLCPLFRSESKHFFRGTRFGFCSSFHRRD